jgi:hypothetical protein
MMHSLVGENALTRRDCPNAKEAGRNSRTFNNTGCSRSLFAYYLQRNNSSIGYNDFTGFFCNSRA